MINALTSCSTVSLPSLLVKSRLTCYSDAPDTEIMNGNVLQQTPQTFTLRICHSRDFKELFIKVRRHADLTILINLF
jgi:hypothetical protein